MISEKGRKVTLTFGALAPTIATQLRAQRLQLEDRRERDLLQECADAIARLTTRGFVTVGEARAVRRRILKRVEDAAKVALRQR